MKRFGYAWLSLAMAIALHVLDEALNDFLPFYNPLVLSLRERLPWFPAPTFTFPVWITGLALGVVLLAVLSRQAFQRRRRMVWPGIILGVLMTFNGLGHVGGSLYYGRLLPGVYSSPVLLAVSLWLLREAWVLRRESRYN
jgi:hypothetical protein